MNGSTASTRKFDTASVVTVRCTRRLLRFLNAGDIDCEIRSPTTRLGDWYANLLSTKHRRLIVCVSERSLLPLFVTAKNPSGFASRLDESMRSVLWTLGVPARSIDCELREMSPPVFASTISRTLVGSLNELIFQARFAIEQEPEIDLLNLALEIAETPCSPLKYATPRIRTLTLLR